MVLVRNMEGSRSIEIKGVYKVDARGRDYTFSQPKRGLEESLFMADGARIQLRFAKALRDTVLQLLK